MDSIIKNAIFDAIEKEPFAIQMGIELKELGLGYSMVEMAYDPATMDNIYSRAHGGAIFALIDGAFETASQTYGTIAVALNVNVTYAASPEPGTRLRAEAREVSKTKRTASYDIRVSDINGNMIAICQALAYRTVNRFLFYNKQLVYFQSVIKI